jgi:3-deoxy-manno-octulosonate cytidylyltransferase (CMP-KDO synthetase)
MKVAIVIPARLASNRFPRKILHNILGLPMIEHVRRRCLLVSAELNVYIATCDPEIGEVIEGFGGSVIMTSPTHENGTSRTAEAIENIDCSHVILVQGDEPLVLPRHIEYLFESMKKKPDLLAWNMTSNITNINELDDKSIVKCAIGRGGKILYCFRRSPSYAISDELCTYTQKMMGMIGFRKDFLVSFSRIETSRIANIESIEQLSIIDAGFNLNSLRVEPSLPSVNTPDELLKVLDILKSDPLQIDLLNSIILSSK